MINRKFLVNLGASIFLVGAMSSVSYAAAPPSIVFHGVEGGRITSSDGTVQVRGASGDRDGILRIDANLEQAGNGMYLNPNGQFVKGLVNLPVQFKKGVRETSWSTLKYRVPAGDYIFRVQAVDNKNKRSKVFEVQVAVKSGAAPLSAGVPLAAIQFPQNGGVVKGRAVFNGTAKGNGNMARVVATLMDAENGLFLARNGRFGQRTELKMQTSGGRNAQWSSPPIQLPVGTYVLSVRGADNAGRMGDWTQSRFTVAAGTAAAAVVANTTPDIIATKPVASATAVTGKGALAANGMKYCSNPAQDIDGDGFGWENKASCVVSGSRADTHPNCASSATDPDGDGFGWENERSCIVVVHCSSAGSDPDGDGFGWENEKSCVVVPAAGRFAKCASAASDPDGDGYGWENNKTCLVN